MLVDDWPKMEKRTLSFSDFHLFSFTVLNSNNIWLDGRLLMTDIEILRYIPISCRPCCWSILFIWFETRLRLCLPQCNRRHLNKDIREVTLKKSFFMIATASVCDWALQSPAHLANKDAMRRRKLQMKIGLERTSVLQNKEPPPI